MLQCWRKITTLTWVFSSVWIQQRLRIPTTIFKVFYSSSLSDTRLFHKMHWWIKELRRSRYFKHDWCIRPIEENELGLTCTFNYSCQGVCFNLQGKSHQTITHTNNVGDPQNKPWSLTPVLWCNFYCNINKSFSLQRLYWSKVRCMVDKLSRMRPLIHGCSSHLMCSPEG